MGEWLRNNPCIYQKTLKTYKDTGKNTSLWAEKATDLNLESGKLLKTWYESIPTTVGKLQDGKSGSAAKGRIERDVFIEDPHTVYLSQNARFLSVSFASTCRSQTYPLSS